MTRRATIVDYGVGNLYSVRRAFEVSTAAEISVSGRAEDIAEADFVILPGVGAFEDGMRGLRERGLVAPVVAAARAGRPVLGICLGMQMLATVSEEFGSHAGLDLIPGQVKAIPRVAADKQSLKVPFIGWAPIQVAPGAEAGSCLRSLAGRAVYLVHSFHVMPDDSRDLLASYEYGGNRITAAIRRDNITGVQFHPEKSGEAGLAIVREFLKTESRS